MDVIEGWAQLLYGVLASPVEEDDAERVRRVKLRRFVLVCYTCQFTYPAHRELGGVIGNLEPLSEKNKNAKILDRVVQELADAITHYQV